MYLKLDSLSETVSTVGFPRVFIIDDMDYTLPEARSFFSNWYVIVIIVVVLVYAVRDTAS